LVYPWLIAAAVLVARGADSKPAAHAPPADKHVAPTPTPAAGTHGAKQSTPARGHEKPSPVGAAVKDAAAKDAPEKKEEAKKDGHGKSPDSQGDHNKGAGNKGGGEKAATSKASHASDAPKDSAHKQEPAKNSSATAAKPEQAKNNTPGQSAPQSKAGDGPPGDHGKPRDHGKPADHAKSASGNHPKPAGGSPSTANQAAANHSSPERTKEPNAPPVLRPGTYIRNGGDRPRSTGHGTTRPARARNDGPFVVTVTESLEPDPKTPDETLELLVRGNQKYLAAQPSPTRPLPSTFARNHSPKVIVLICSDAAFVPETLFGLSSADLVNVRVAGAVASREQAASIAYAFTYADPKLLVVLGHLDCPVTRAAVEGERMPGELAALLAPLESAVDKTRYYNPGLRGEALLQEATRVNVWTSVQDLMRGSEIISRKLRAGALKVVGGVVDFRTGRVNWMGEYPAQLSSALR
jgi:carbonic anhydrase